MIGRRARGAGAAVVLAALLGSGCLVQVFHVKDPGPIFREARTEASRLAGRPGPPRQLNVLVWKPDEGELVRVSVPFWLARRLAKQADLDEGDFDGADEVEDILRRRIHLAELEKTGRGTLVEVEEEDGEQVLVWLR